MARGSSLRASTARRSFFGRVSGKPENDVARSVVIAAPLIALMYILATSSVLAYISPDKVDVAAAVPQVMQAGFGAGALGRVLTAIVSIGFSISFMASMVIVTGMVARLPMVAGWDGLLPGWWSELHPRFQTPSKAILAVAACMMLLGVLSLLGAGNQEAVQVGAGAEVGSLCIMYMVLFGVILFGFRTGHRHFGWGIRIAALAAFSVALAALVFQIVPVGDVSSSALFAVKVAVTICAANGLGAFLYWRGTRRLQRVAAAASA